MDRSLVNEISWLKEKIARMQTDQASSGNDELATDLQMAMAIFKRLNNLSGAFKYALYNDFVGRYHEWYKGTVGVAPKFTPAYGKAMKEIIGYLVEQATDKTEEGALKAWEFILLHWALVSPFLQQQKGLLQINKNISEILDHIRNGHHKTNTKSRTAELEQELGIGTR